MGHERIERHKKFDLKPRRGKSLGKMCICKSNETHYNKIPGLGLDFSSLRRDRVIHSCKQASKYLCLLKELEFLAQMEWILTSQK